MRRPDIDREAFARNRAAGLHARYAAKLARIRQDERKATEMAREIDRTPRNPFTDGFSYDKAFDGTTWQIVQGEDFTLAPSTMITYLRIEHERRFGKLIAELDKNNPRAVIIQHMAGRG